MAKSQSPQSALGRLAQIAQSRIDWGWIIVITFILGFILKFPLLGLLPVTAYALLLGLRTSEIATAFTCLSIALLSFILVNTDIFFIPDVFGNRMNTVFKFYYQVWTLGGVLAAYTIWVLLQRARIHQWRYLKPVSLGLFGLLLVGGMVYPVLALKQRTNGTQQALRGFTARETRNAGEREAVLWLSTHCPPDAIVLEAVGESYDSTGTRAGGIAGATGLQTVLGWSGHDDQWRHGDPTTLSEITMRKADVQTIYTSRNHKQVLELLQKYNIREVVVGESEYQTYPGLNTAVFERVMAKVFTSSDRKLVIFERG